MNHPLRKKPDDYVKLTPAQRAVSAERRKVYGHPFENHMGISMAAAGLLQPHWESVRDLVPLPPHVWALVLGGALKINRCRLVFHDDNYLDAQVYQNFARGWQEWFSVTYPGGPADWRESWTGSGALGEAIRDGEMQALREPEADNSGDPHRNGAVAGHVVRRRDGGDGVDLDALPEPLTDFVGDVRAFHKKFGASIGIAGQNGYPGFSYSGKENCLRRDLVMEEAQEFAEAFGESDFTECVDALIDLIYVSVGSLVAWGVDIGDIWSAVHESNMQKEPDPNGGKVLKPEGWKHPDISQLLHEQRMRGSRAT